MKKKHGFRSFYGVAMSALLAVFVAQATAQAAHIYVKSGGSASADYDSWDDAFGDLQSALDHVMANEPQGANIYLAGGTYEGEAIGASYPENTVFLLQSVSNIVIRGGFEGVSGSGDSPGTHDPETHPTVLRLTSGSGRVLTLDGLSNAVIEHVTIRDGYFESGAQGGGVRLADSKDVRFKGVSVIHNRAQSGAGFYFTGSDDVLIESSSVVSNTYPAAGASYGGGLFLTSSTLTVTNALVAHNRLANVGGSSQRSGRGGGIHVGAGSSLTLSRSIVRENTTRTWWQHAGYGGGLHVIAGASADVRDSVFVDNFAESTAGPAARGGGIANEGTLTLRNVLVADNESTHDGDGIWSSGTLHVENATIANNNIVGIYRDSGTVTVTNSIIWGHSGLDVQGFVEDDGVYPAIWYSNLGGGVNAGFQGGQSVDPLFADTVHYHLQSTAAEGVYSNAYFAGGVFGTGVWVSSPADSPLIARGDPSSDNSRDPHAGDRINMGAYGNTEVASKKADTATAAPTVDNPGAAEWGRTSALLRGEVTDDGGDFAEAYFRYWADGSVVTSVVTRGVQTGAFSHRASGLSADTLYYYQAGATNSLGMTWSTPESFETHPVGSHFYVASGGDNTAGTNWATAFPDLRTALLSARDGDSVYLAGGQTFSGAPAFLDNTVFRWEHATNVVLRGGYQATSGSGDSPGANDPDTWPTVLARTSGEARILTLNGLENAVIENVTIRDGLFSSSGQGGGIRLADSQDVHFSDMQIIHNQAQRGAGFFVTGSSDVIIESSSVVSNVYPANGESFGAGIFSETSTLTVTNVLIADGVLAFGGSSNRSGSGGGVYIASGTVDIIRSMIVGNHIFRWHGPTGSTTRGAGLCVASGATGNILESVIAQNEATIYNGSTAGGGIANEGTLYLRNVLVIDNECTHDGDGIWSSGTTVINNATIADNNPSRVDNRGVHYDSGTISITNSIIDGHAFDLSNFGAGQLANVWYSNIRDGQNEGEQGCLALDPLFVDRTYFHLQSTVSNYTDAYFEGGIFGTGTWAVSVADSPLIAKGDPNSDFTREPMPNGGRINMGAYGNTEVAAMWAEIDVDPPSVTTYGALRWGYTTAHLRGEVTDTGGEIPEAFFRYWPSMGGGSTTTVSRSLQAGAFTLNATGLTPGTEYNFQAGAENDGGTTWANVEMFSTRALGAPLYVSANGSDTAGSTWATAYTNLQTAFDLARTGTIVYLAAETFAGSPAPAANEIFIWQNASNVVIRGGYAADPGLAAGDHPGPRTGETILSRSSGNARVLTMSGLSNAVIEQVTIRDGYYPAQEQGGGVRLADSEDVQFVNVIILDNLVNARGGGVYITDSAGVIFDSSSIISNRTDTKDNYGAGLFMQSSSVLVTNSLVAANSVVKIINSTSHLHGGGIYVGSGGNLDLRRSIIRENFGNTDYPGTGNHSHGGGLFVHTDGTLDARESVVVSNRLSWSRSSGYQMRGAGIANRGISFLQNVLVVDNAIVNPNGNDRGDGIWSDGTLEMQNVTIANNNTAHAGNVGVLFVDGTLSISNSIVWGHVDADLENLPVDGNGHLLNVGYTLFGGIPGMHEVNGCIVGVDPLFEDTVYYHLQSEQGVYQGGYFDGGTWGESAATSPAIDAGDPNLPDSAWEAEPFPNGRLLNLGAYGGTPVASMTPTAFGTVFLFR